MFRLKENIDIKELLKYGFKENHFDPCYEYTTDEYTIFCYRKDRENIKGKYLYIEINSFGILEKFDKIVELYESGIIEHIED